MLYIKYNIIITDTSYVTKLIRLLAENLLNNVIYIHKSWNEFGILE